MSVEISNIRNPECRYQPPEGTVLLAYRGSIAHNMYVPNTDPNSIDDVDLIGFIVPTEQRYLLGIHEWGSRGTKEFKQGEYDAVHYEIRKAASLLLQGNPNIMSVLWLRRDHYILLEPEGKTLIDNRGLLVGKHVYNSFAGYAHAQLEKMETREPAELRRYIALTVEAKVRGIHPNHKGEVIPYPDGYDNTHGEALDAVNTNDVRLLQGLASYIKKGENIGYLGDKRKQLVLQHGYDAKNAAHCIRLLRMCKEFLSTGEMFVYRQSDAAELLNIKRGKWSLKHVKQLASQLFEEVRAARDASPLPAHPERQAVENIVAGILSDHVCRKRGASA